MKLKYIQDPRRGFEKADALLKKGASSRAAAIHEAALQSELCRTRQLSPWAFGALNIRRHLMCDQNGVPRRIVVNDLEIHLRASVAKRVARHVRIFRPALVHGEDTGALFPAGVHRLVGRLACAEFLMSMNERSLRSIIIPHSRLRLIWMNPRMTD